MNSFLYLARTKKEHTPLWWRNSIDAFCHKESSLAHSGHVSEFESYRDHKRNTTASRLPRVNCAVPDWSRAASRLKRPEMLHPLRRLATGSCLNSCCLSLVSDQSARPPALTFDPSLTPTRRFSSAWIIFPLFGTVRCEACRRSLWISSRWTLHLIKWPVCVFPPLR